MANYFIDRPVFAWVLAIIMMLAGGLAIMNLPVAQYPQIAPPTITISATYPGADAQTVEDSVTQVIEQNMNGLDGLMYMSSTSDAAGNASITLTFETGTSPDIAQVQVQNKLQLAMPSLPEAVQQQGISVDKSSSNILMVAAFISDNGSLNQYDIADYVASNIKDPLSRTAGVGSVQLFGSEYAMRIWLKPDLLDYYKISLDEVFAAVEAQGGIFPAGKFGGEPAAGDVTYTYTVTMPPQIYDAEQFGDIIISTTPEGEQVRLSDIADVALGSRQYGVESLFNSDPTALLVIYQQPGSNAVDVGNSVKAEMERLSKRFPDGITYTSMVDATTSIEAGVKDIFVTLIIALILVIAIIFLFLQDWRATLIPLLAIPVSIIGAFALFPLLGFSINIISLLGMVLAIGLVVDDAIVVVEAVQVNIEKGLSAKQATVEAMHSVSSPIVATTVVLLAVFIPVSFMGSITGLLFQQFSISIAVSVCISSFNALTLSPALCALLLKPRPKVQKGFFAAFNRWFGKRTEEYTSATTRFIGHLKRTGGIVAVTLAAIAVIWHFLPSGFLPDEDQGYVMVFVQTPEASSLQTTVKAMQRVDELVRQRPDVEATSFAAGFNMLAGIASSNSGIIFVKLVDYSQRSKTSSQIASALTEELYVAVPEAVSYAFISPSIPGLGVTSGITLQVQDLEGRGTEFLADETMRFMDSLRKQPQIGSVTTQFNAGIPQRRIEVDKEKALAQGVPLRSFYKTMSTLLGGSYINNFNRFGKLYQTYIQAAPEYRRDKYSLESYFVDDGQGNSIPVSSFTTVRDTTGVEFVSQFNLYRSIELTVNPAAKVSTGQAMDAIEAVAADVLPEAVGTTWSGLSYQEKTASGSSGAVYLLAIVFVFLTLSALYNSWGLPLAILLSVPLAVLGALLFVGAAYLVSPEFINNIYMQISLVMLIGLSAKNAILVVEYADQLFFEKNMDLKAATIEAARLRMRPIMMTAFSFILGVMPLIFASGVYATARNIMGMALVGGMLLATMLGIFIYPALYYLVARVGKFERKRELKQKES